MTVSLDCTPSETSLSENTSEVPIPGRIKAVSACALDVLLFAGCFCLQPNLAWGALVVGYVFVQHTEKYVAQVEKLAALNCWKGICYLVALVFLAKFSLPNTITTLTCYYGIRWGVIVAKKADSLIQSQAR